MNFFEKYAAYIKDNPKKYWFKRKVFGWGWTPVTWQGLLVTAAFVVVIVWNVVRIDSVSHSASDTLLNAILQTAALVFVFLIILWRTGEPPKWMWGFPKDDDPKNEHENI